MKTSAVRFYCVVGALLAGTLITVITVNSTQWIGRQFPGFLLLDNRVIASVSLPDWGDNTPVFQHQVVKVDGISFDSTEEIYGYLGTLVVGEHVQYELRAPGGDQMTIVKPVRAFALSDYALIFGAFLLNGFIFLFIGLAVVYMSPNSSAARALLSTCLSTGVFVTTAVDLYGPHVFFRLHAAAEAMAAASFIHLAASFPTDRLGRNLYRKLLWVYLPFVGLALAYQNSLYDPDSYTFFHLLASGGFGICTTGIVISILFDLFVTRSVLVRRRIAVVALGSITGVLPLTLVWAISGLVGGKIALNAAALTAFFFPMSIAFAVLNRDLFEIDVFLRRALAYGAVMITIMVSYFVVLYGFEVLMPGRDYLGHSPVLLALLNLVLLFGMAPTRDAAQRLIDRVFFRKAYEVEAGLALLSDRLATAREQDDVEDYTRAVLAETVCPERVLLLFQNGSSRTFMSASGERVEVPNGVLRFLRLGERVTKYLWEDGKPNTPESWFWGHNSLEILLPLRSETDQLRILALGAKQSGNPYNANDISFLDTAANQISLAVANAIAFGQLGDLNHHLEALNESLEEQVGKRTAELNGANEELNRSLDKLQGAYRELEKNHASLLRADRLATLGRLTAGIAHEINTPLSAVLNALKVVSDLADEYLESIDDPSVESMDHKQIADEIRSTTASAREWGDRAAAYVRSVKQHGRESRTGTVDQFSVREVVDKTADLVAHRLRAAACRLEIQEDVSEIKVWGDPGRLGQVLVNLVTNAIDAYEDRGMHEGLVQVSIGASAEGETVIEVADHAGGIPEEVRPHIFDELYTTKEPGRGTGLGLWISRNIMEEGFGGTLHATSDDGVGARFVAVLPGHVGDQVPRKVAAAVAA